MDFVLDQDEMEFMNLSRVSASSMSAQEKPLELLSLQDVQLDQYQVKRIR